MVIVRSRQKLAPVKAAGPFAPNLRNLAWRVSPLEADVPGCGIQTCERLADDELVAVLRDEVVEGSQRQAPTANGLKVDLVIAKIAGGWPASRWDDLTPWNWAQDQTPIAQAA